MLPEGIFMCMSLIVIIDQFDAKQSLHFSIIITSSSIKSCFKSCQHYLFVLHINIHAEFVKIKSIETLRLVGAKTSAQGVGDSHYFTVGWTNKTKMIGTFEGKSDN